MKTLSTVRSSPLFFLFAVATAACGQGADPDLVQQSAAVRTLPSDGDEDGAIANGVTAGRSCGTASTGKWPRKVVVSHPYDVTGSAATDYEILSLAKDGTLTRPGTKFTLGTMTEGEIVFTPDGQVGLAVQYDGSIGVFRFDSAGAVHVVSPRVTTIAYASRLAMDPSGNRVYVLSTQWRESGGGIFAARIACDGTLTSEGLIAAAKLPAGLVFLPDAASGQPRALAVARDILTSPAATNFHLLRFNKKPRVLTSADGFGDEQQIVSAVAKTADDRYVLAADNNLFSGIPNRIAVVEVAGSTLRPAQLLTGIQDPVSMVMSPYGNAGLVVSGFGNALYRLSYNVRSRTPFVNAGPLTYVGGRPQLPAAAVMLDKGPLRGRVLVAEVTGIRQVAFQSDGSITDLGVTAFGEDLDGIVGGLGITP